MRESRKERGWSSMLSGLPYALVHRPSVEAILAHCRQQHAAFRASRNGWAVSALLIVVSSILGHVYEVRLTWPVVVGCLVLVLYFSVQTHRERVPQDVARAYRASLFPGILGSVLSPSTPLPFLELGLAACCAMLAFVFWYQVRIGPVPEDVVRAYVESKSAPKAAVSTDGGGVQAV